MDTERALKKLANLVKDSRATLGMTQEQYARLFGDRSPSISRLEKADYIDLPNHNTLEKLAEILRIPYWELIKYLSSDDRDVLTPKPLTEEQIIAGIKQNFPLKSLLNIDWELRVEIERRRHQVSPDNGSQQTHGNC